MFLTVRDIRQRKRIRKILVFLYELEFGEKRAIDAAVEIVSDIMATLSASGDNPVLLMKRLRKSFSIKISKSQTMVTVLPALSNRYCYGLSDYLRKRYPLLTQLDLDFCSLLAMGLSAADIDFACGYDHPVSFYNRRYKIRKKMDVPQAVDLEAYLRNLSKQLETRLKEAVRRGMESKSLTPVLKMLEL